MVFFFIQNRRISGSDRENANMFLSCIHGIDNTFLTLDEILFYFKKPFAYRLNRTEKRQKLNVIYDYKKKIVIKIREINLNILEKIDATDSQKNA